MSTFALFLLSWPFSSIFFFFNDTATTEIYTLSLHDALPISTRACRRSAIPRNATRSRSTLATAWHRSEEHTSELQSRRDLVCRLLLEKKKKKEEQTYTKTKRQNIHTSKTKCNTEQLCTILIV